MVGDYVGVVWNTSPQRKEIRGEDGETYSATVQLRSGAPYIDFLTIRESKDEGFYEDEDSPAEGGLSASAAEQIATELRLAVDYLNFVNQQ